MKLYSKEELKLLVWKLIKQEGLTYNQATRRVADLISETRINHNKALKEKKQEDKSKTFKEKFTEMIGKTNGKTKYKD